MTEFSGLGLGLGNLARVSTARTRSISPENFSGQPGQGGMATEPILRALNIPIWHLTDSRDIYRRLKDAQTLAHASLHPVAVLLSRELMWEE